MTRPAKLGVRFGLSCVLPVLAFLPAPFVMAQQQEMEEVVVTGSYIKRDSFDSASPLTVVNQEQIAVNAEGNLGELLANQTFNYGTDYQTNTYAARAQGGNTSNANLRGLGTSATLQLIDGKRTVYDNLNNKLPQIAIQRIDILRDGASAVYGSDAVAGVVNIIPRKNFTGLEMSAFYSRAEDLDEHAYEFIMGSDTDNGHITMSGAFRTRGQLQQTDRPKFLRQGFEQSGTGNPGTWSVPNRDPVTGALTGTASRRIDPGCGTANGPGGNDKGSKRNFQSGEPTIAGVISVPAAFADTCALHFGEWWNYINPNTQWSVWANYQYEFTDELTNELDVNFNRLDTDSRGSIQNPGGRTEEFPVVLGTHPGNPYRAFADTNTNGVVNAGEQLFAQDLFDEAGNAVPDGIPDRDPNTDVDGDGVPDVILSATPFLAGGASNGIAFNEDVSVLALRAMGKLGNQATQINKDGSNNGNSTFTTSVVRVFDEMTYLVPDSSWEVTAYGLYEVQHTTSEEKNTSQRALEQGIMGTLVPEPPSSGLTPTYWNPFSTSQLSCTDRVCSDTGTPDFANSVPVMDSINILANDVVENEAFQLQVVGTGELIEIPTGGMIEAAFGATYRREESNVDVGTAENECDWHQGGCGKDWISDQDFYSIFYEFFVPVLDTLDVSIAGGYTDYGGDIGDSFDPKFTVQYRPLDVLSLRGSWSSAFIAPTLLQQFATPFCFLETASDAINGDTSNSFRVTCTEGNDSLQPEQATTWNVGASVSLLDGDLNLGIDYAVYDFEDRIARETQQQVLTRDANNFVAAGGTLGDLGDVQDWINGTLNGQGTDPNIHRQSVSPFFLTRADTTFVNAQEMKNKSWDAYGRYTIPFDAFGTFTVSLNATYIDEYSYDLGAGLASGDGAGKQNETVAEVPPLPQWRVTGNVSWLYGNHAANLRVRRISEYDMDFNSGFLASQQVAINGETTFEPATYVDVQYGYSFADILGTGREARLEVGIKNLMDYFPDPIFNLGGIETFTHDIRGRTWYGRINVNL
jgi:iron complex outermembrane receptor protein